MTSEINNLARRRTSYIEIYSFSNGPYNTTKNPTIKFPAFLTDFSDSYKSQFSSEPVYGKMDPIATFKNTSRSITLNFDIPSVSAADAKENLSKISYLIPTKRYRINSFTIIFFFSFSIIYKHKKKYL